MWNKLQAFRTARRWGEVKRMANPEFQKDSQQPKDIFTQEVIEQLVSCFRHGNVRQDIFFLFCHRVCYGAVGRSLQIVRRSGIPTACSGKTDNP